LCFFRKKPCKTAFFKTPILKFDLLKSTTPPQAGSWAWTLRGESPLLPVSPGIGNPALRLLLPKGRVFILYRADIPLGDVGLLKEQTMKTKHGLFFGFAVLLVAAIFSLTGCPTEDDDDGGGGNTITITLEKLSDTSFSITLDNVTWIPSDPGGAYVNVFLDVLDMDACVLDYTDPDNSGDRVPFHTDFDTALSSDSKTVTATLREMFANAATLSGTIKFISNPDLGQFAGQFTGKLVPEAGGNASYVGTPEAGISF
jgi:hypothetical protein